MGSTPYYQKVQILDVEIIQTLAGGAGFPEMEIFRELLGVFLAEKNKHVAGLQEAAEEPDRSRMNQLFHSMGGAAANLGLVRLASVCSYLEGITGEVEDEDLPDLVRTLEEEYRISLVEVHRQYPILGLEERL